MPPKGLSVVWSPWVLLMALGLLNDDQVDVIQINDDAAVSTMLNIDVPVRCLTMPPHSGIF